MKVHISREILNSPSNSKSSGSTHRVALGAASVNNGGVDLDEGTITTATVGATFKVGRGQAREVVTIPVVVTGVPTDTTTIEVGGSQKLRVQFAGVRKLKWSEALGRFGIELTEGKLPALRGSEKQVTWARSLRLDQLVGILESVRDGRLDSERAATRLSAALAAVEAKEWIES